MRNVEKVLRSFFKGTFGLFFVHLNYFLVQLNFSFELFYVHLKYFFVFKLDQFNFIFWNFIPLKRKYIFHGFLNLQDMIWSLILEDHFHFLSLFWTLVFPVGILTLGTSSLLEKIQFLVSWISRSWNISDPWGSFSIFV